MKTPATLTLLLVGAALSLHAQTAPGTSSSQAEEQRPGQQTPSYDASASPSVSPSDQQRRDEEKKKRDREQQEKARQAQTQSPKPAAGSTWDSKQASNQPADIQRQDQGQTSQNTAIQGGQTTTAQTSTRSGTQTNVAVTGQVDTEVRTVVEQIDAQGPVVVERISTRFADVTCSEANARALVEALHGGTSVTLRGDNGETATFTPTTQLGYGEAYITLALAAEALRQAGITGCASPAQWQAVLMGGELRAPGSTVATTTVTTGRFPGILVLREQGGWAKVAQTTNIQLNQVVSQANTNLQLNTSGREQLSPVGRPRDYDPLKGDQANPEHSTDHKDKKNPGNKDASKKDPAAPRPEESPASPPKP